MHGHAQSFRPCGGTSRKALAVAVQDSVPAHADDSNGTPAGPLAAVRISNADRARTASVVAEATAAGYLTVAELDERLATAWAATTSADLERAQVDIPDDVRRAVARREAAEKARAVAREGLRGHVTSYLSVMALLVGIWLVVGVTAGAWYPWPVWPALGWGIGVAGHVRAARAHA
jgi:hypothetical protein